MSYEWKIKLSSLIVFMVKIMWTMWYDNANYPYRGCKFDSCVKLHSYFQFLQYKLKVQEYILKQCHKNNQKKMKILIKKMLQIMNILILVLGTSKRITKWHQILLMALDSFFLSFFFFTITKISRHWNLNLLLDYEKLLH